MCNCLTETVLILDVVYSEGCYFQYALGWGGGYEIVCVEILQNEHYAIIFNRQLTQSFAKYIAEQT